MLSFLRIQSAAIILLVFATLIVVLLQEFSLNKRLVFDVDTHFPAVAISDSDELGGQSKAEVIHSSDHFQLQCTLVHADYPWPFCEFQLVLFQQQSTAQQFGLNLSGYDHIELHVKYLNDVNLPIRFQIRSFEPGISTINNNATWKYNGVEIHPKFDQYPYLIPTRALQVATWWLAEQKVPIQQATTNLSQALMLEIATGNNMPAGHYTLRIDKLVFHGKYLPTRRVYLGCLFVWMLTGLAIALRHVYYTRKQLIDVQSKALELKKLNKLLNIESSKLRDKVERDPLTGALNRSGIKPVFTEQLKVLALMFIDIDHFKAINDNFGHQTGDEVLIQFSKLISENCRDTDFLARWGGEEFLLVCPNTSLTQAHALAEDLRHLISASSWPHQQPMTASFGVGQRHLNESATEFIDRVDKALYAAKARGRNRVVCSQ